MWQIWHYKASSWHEATEMNVCLHGRSGTQHLARKLVHVYRWSQLQEIFKEPMFIGVNADDAPYILANGYQNSKTYVSCSDTAEGEEYWTTLRIFQPWTCVVNQESNERLRTIFELAVLLPY